MLGAFRINTWVATLIATGMILSASYMLYLYRRVIFGKLVKQGLTPILDLGPREILVFAPLVLIVMLMGISPLPLLDAIDVTVTKLVADYTHAFSAANHHPDAAR